jgi:hypothetical protein
MGTERCDELSMIRGDVDCYGLMIQMRKRGMELCR